MTFANTNEKIPSVDLRLQKSQKLTALYLDETGSSVFFRVRAIRDFFIERNHESITFLKK